MNQAMGSSSGQDEGSSNLLGSLPFILWQRRWFVIVPAAVIALMGIAAAFLIPSTYRAKAELLVESENLPDSTVSASLDNVIDRRIAKIRQQILARPDLVGLIQANNLYDANDRKQPLSVLVDRMRAATDISAVDADIKAQGGQNAGSIAFQLTFDYPAAAQAQLVAQTFVDRLLRLDASQTQSEAQANVHFLEDQQASLQSQVAEVESQINQITGQNGSALAGAGGLGMISIGGSDYESQIANLRRENVQLQSQLGGMGLGRDAGVLAAEAQLAAAKAQYSDNYPDVKLAEIRLAAAKANAKTTLSTAITAPVEQQISANNEAIAQLEAARGASLSRAAAIASAQSRGPVIAQHITQLSAKAQLLRDQLAKVSNNLLTANSVVKLADEQLGERLTLIEPPVTPDTPTSPNRPLLIFGGIAVGLVVGIVLAVALEMIIRPIRSVSALTRLVGVPPLAVVPVLSEKTPRRPHNGRFDLRQKLASLVQRRPAVWRRRTVAAEQGNEA
jgi:uncharacterized protein involved in exopolysaccharide biosynthesis